jgi:hypothetical protein
VAEIELGYDVLGSRIRSIGPFEIEYPGLLKQASRAGSLELVYRRAVLVSIGPAEMTYDRLGGRLIKLGDWDCEYDWMGTRVRRIGPYDISYDRGGSRVRDVGPMKLQYSKGGTIPQSVLVPDEDAVLPEEHLIVLYHVFNKVQTTDRG